MFAVSAVQPMLQFRHQAFSINEALIPVVSIAASTVCSKIVTFVIQNPASPALCDASRMPVAMHNLDSRGA